MREHETDSRAGEQGAGRVQRLLAAGYGRSQGRGIWICLAVAILAVLFTYWLTILAAARYLRVSTGRFWLMGAVSLPVVATGVPLALFVARRPLAPVRGWEGGE